ncbi:MAG: transposase [Vicinamibacterales bacterium]
MPRLIMGGGPRVTPRRFQYSPSGHFSSGVLGQHLVDEGLIARYVLRPPVTGDRVAVAADGRVRLRLRHPWADGTTHVAFEPTAFLERLAVLVPRPRINLLRYHGVLAAHAAWRTEVVARAPSGGAAPGATAGPDATTAPSPGPAGRRWADLMRRAFEVDVLACPRCGGRLRLVALLEAGPVTARILRHLGLPSEVPSAASGAGAPALERRRVVVTGHRPDRGHPSLPPA